MKMGLQFWLSLLLTLAGVRTTFSQTATIAWSPSSDPAAVGYIVYCGTASGEYSSSNNVGANTYFTISNLTAGVTYYIVTTAFNSSGVQSLPSNEIIYQVPNAALITLTNLRQNYDGASKPVTATASPSAAGLSLTYNGSPNPPTNAGSYTVIASALAPYTGRTTNTLVIIPAPATVTLSGLNQAFTGGPCLPGVVTSPADLPVNLTYSGLTSEPTNAGAYTVVATSADPNYLGGATNTLIIAPAAANIYLTNLTAIYNGASHPVGAETVPPGLPVTITYNGDINAPVDAGRYTVSASVLTSNYTANVQAVLAIKPAAVLIKFYALAQIFDGNPKTPGVVTLPASLPVSLSYDSGTAPAAVGACAVTASVNNPNYTGDATNILTIYDPAQAIVLAWSSEAANPAIYESTNLTQWSPLIDFIGPTNRLVVPKVNNNHFFAAASVTAQGSQPLPIQIRAAD